MTGKWSPLITKRGNNVILAVFVIIGLVAVVAIRDAQLALYVFLQAAAVLSWVFVALFGLRSTWRQTDPAKALFWLGLTCALASTRGALVNVFDFQPWWIDDMGQLFYLAFITAILNMILTVAREQHETNPPVVRRRFWDTDWPLTIAIVLIGLALIATVALVLLP